VATTVLISFKGERDTIRKPPVIFPCDTETRAFDPTACRWALEGYQRVLAPQATAGGLLPFTLTGNMVRTYIPTRCSTRPARRCWWCCWPAWQGMRFRATVFGAIAR
jgi:hypothetical protein